MKIKLIKFKDNLIKPTRGHYNDAGLDCYAQEDIILPPMQSKSYFTMFDDGTMVIEDCVVKKVDWNGKDAGKEYRFEVPTKYPRNYFRLKYPKETMIDTHLLISANSNLINLGFGLEVPDGYMATIRPRSSMNAKGILTQIGTIDSGYRGEIKAILVNLTGEPILIMKGDKICQLVIEPVVLADLVEDLGEERGTGGFGSTGR